jgi:hypothetical protein
VRIGAPLKLENVRDRKKLTAISEAQLRRNFAELVTARTAAE